MRALPLTFTSWTLQSLQSVSIMLLISGNLTSSEIDKYIVYVYLTIYILKYIFTYLCNDLLASDEFTWYGMRARY
jgi:hypothetical protein